jgi:hypothetical protein
LKKYEKSKSKENGFRLIGYYTNFPAKVHGVATLVFQTGTSQLQRIISETLSKLNNETHDLGFLTKASPPNCQVNFELGIAEEDTFTFLDKGELARIIEALEKEETLGVLDFLCAARYKQIMQDGKAKSLKFDYVLLRFAFRRRTMELFLSHQRGIQRLPLGDLTTFLINRINKELAQNKMKPLTLKHMRTL